MCCRGQPRGRGIHVGRHIIAGRIFPIYPVRPIYRPPFPNTPAILRLGLSGMFFSKAIFIAVCKNDFKIVFTNTISKAFFSRTISKLFFKKLIPKSFLRKTISKSFYFSKTISKSSFRKTISKSFFSRTISESFLTRTISSLFVKTISKSFYFSGDLQKFSFKLIFLPNNAVPVRENGGLPVFYR